MFEALQDFKAFWKAYRNPDTILVDSEEYRIYKNFWTKEHRNMSKILESNSPYQFDARIEVLKDLVDAYGKSEAFNDVDLIRRGFSAKKIMEMKANANLVYIVEAMKSTNPMYTILILESSNSGIRIVVDLALSTSDSEIIMNDIYRKTSEFYLESSIEHAFAVDRLCHKIDIHGRECYPYLQLFIERLNSSVYDKILEKVSESENEESVPTILAYLKGFKRELDMFPKISNLDFGHKEQICAIYESNIKFTNDLITKLEGDINGSITE